MKTVWRARDRSLADYGAIFASKDRLLLIGSGELLLVDPSAPKFQVLNRLKVFDDRAEIYSHPAIVGKHLFIRGESAIRCISLGD